MKITFLEAASGVRLVKSFTPNKTIPYPFVSKMNSYEMEINSIEEFESALRTGAEKGWMMLRGGLTKILKNESRRGYNDQSQKIYTITFDIDGIDSPLPMPEKCDSGTVRRVAESIVGRFPQLADISYVAKGSSSFGRERNRISLHLEFILESPVSPTELKLYLKHLNVTNPLLSENIKLSANKAVLSFPLDIAVANGAHHVNCAPPIFDGVPDPFEGRDAERIVLIKKGFDRLKIDTKIDIAATNKLENTILQTLRKSEGLGVKTTKISYWNNGDGEAFEVLTKPGEMTISIFDDHGDFVHADINGGDSHSYYWPKNNPTFIYNFKGEPIFKMRDASPSFFNAYRKKYRDIILQSHGLQKGERPIVFREPLKDVFYSMIYCSETDEIRQFAPLRQSSISNFLRSWGDEVPEVLPEYLLKFKPDTNVQFDENEGWVNLFRPTKYLKAEGLPSGQKATKYGTLREAVLNHCSAIYANVLHVLGDDFKEAEHFLNWLAYVVQTRGKSGTAWILSGRSGTGKGLLFQKILQPIFGQYAKVAQSRTIDDTFNIFLLDCLILFVDEFRMESGAQGAKTNDILKNTITDETLVYREMRQAPFSDYNFTNFIFASNDIDVMRIADDDRRINVGTRQERSMKDTYPTLPDLLDDEDALYKFAQICMAHEVDEEKVRELVVNKAREHMQYASMNSTDQFFHALKEGDLDWFIEYTVYPVYGKDDTFKFLAAKNIVEGWVTHKDEINFVTVADLKAVFDTIMKYKDADPAFNTKLLKRGFAPERIRNKITKKRQNAVHVQWKLLNYESDEVLGEIARSTGNQESDNVVSLHA